MCLRLGEGGRATREEEREREGYRESRAAVGVDPFAAVRRSRIWAWLWYRVTTGNDPRVFPKSNRYVALGVKRATRMGDILS